MGTGWQVQLVEVPGLSVGRTGAIDFSTGFLFAPGPGQKGTRSSPALGFRLSASGDAGILLDTHCRQNLLSLSPHYKGFMNRRVGAEYWQRTESFRRRP